MALEIKRIGDGRVYRVNGWAITSEALETILSAVLYPHVWADVQESLRTKGSANIRCVLDVSRELEKARERIAQLESKGA